MPVDRYTKIVLTIIALELGWIGAKGAGIPLAAQRADPAPVVITGVELTSGRTGALPVMLAGTIGAVKIATDSPIAVTAPQPLRVDVAGPVVVETADNPLLIRSVQAEPAKAPGL